MTLTSFCNRQFGIQKSKAWKALFLGQLINGMVLEFSLIPLTMMERLVESRLLANFLLVLYLLLGAGGKIMLLSCSFALKG